MRRLLAAVGTVALGAGLAIAADAPPPAVDALVRQLGDRRYVDREAAARALAQAGPAAVPALEDAAASSPDPEIRQRAAAVLDQITRAADSARYTAGKAVKLDYRNVPLADVVADLRKQTGINLTLVPGRVGDPARPVTLTGGDAPAWQAVDALCAAAGLREDHRTELPLPATAPAGNTAYYRSPRFYGDAHPGSPLTPSNAPILLVDGAAEPLPGTRAGGVRVLVLPGRFPANKVVRGDGRVVLHLDVAPLPGLHWQEATGVRITRAEDEDGRPLFADRKAAPDGSGDPFNSPWGIGGRVVWLGGGAIAFSSFDGIADAQPQKVAPNPRLVPVPLRTDDRVVKALRRLDGVVLGEVSLPNVPVVTVDDLRTAVGKTFDGPNQSRLTVVDYKAKEDGSASVRVRAEVPQPWVLQQMRGGRGLIMANSLENNLGNVPATLKFFDAAGKPCAAPTQTSANYSGDQMRQSFEVELRFAKSASAGVPVKLVQVGNRTVPVEVPFRAENVKLP